MPSYSYFYYDTIYWIIMIPILILSVYAQIKVSSSFKRYSRERSSRGVTGAQAAYEVLRANGVHDVAIRPCRGSLTDHYDPRDNTIYLSEPVYNAATVAAVGVAAHEAGHAVQYAVGYRPGADPFRHYPGHTVWFSICFYCPFPGAFPVFAASVCRGDRPLWTDHPVPAGDAAGGVQRLRPRAGHH